MNAVFEHWSADPFELVVALVVIVHLRGLRAWLRAIRNAGRPTVPWVEQALLFYLGLAVFVIAIASPIDFWSDQYLSVHIIQHILLSFVAPPLLVLGAPWLPMLRGMPAPLRRGLGHLLQRTRPGRAEGNISRALASIRRIAARPMTSVVLFNATMLFWHFPGPYDLGLANTTVHIWLEHTSFFLLGVALWLQVFGSYPLRPVLDAPRRVLVLISTNGVMVAVAMTLVMFSRDLYPWYAAGHSLAQRSADQQIGGAILWVCGEITFLPSILYTVTRWLDEGPSARSPHYPRRPLLDERVDARRS